VGSDPYLAPEVFAFKDYDAQAVDIWSLAIIYCCLQLRRFPWKAPRPSDNSYKIFIAEPSPGHDPRVLAPPPHAKHKLSQGPQAAPSAVPPPPAAPKQAAATYTEDKGKHMASPPAASLVTSTPSSISTDGTNKDNIQGPWRILRLLPRETRYIIGRMLQVNPLKRATMQEMLEDPWIADAIICRQSIDGIVTRAKDHIHTLQPPAPKSGAA